MNKYLFIPDGRLIHEATKNKLVSNGYKITKNIVGLPDDIDHYINDANYKSKIDDLFKILIITYLFVPDMRIINKDEAREKLSANKYKRINHIIGTVDDLKTHQLHPKILNNRRLELISQLLDKEGLELGNFDRVVVSNINSFLKTNDMMALSVSKVYTKFIKEELIRRTEIDFREAAKVGRDDILIQFEPLIINRLKLAVEVGNIEYTKSILYQIPDTFDRSILNMLSEIAAKYNQMGMIKLLITYGLIDLGKALQKAARYGNNEIIIFLLKETHNDYEKYGRATGLYVSGSSAFLQAARSGNMNTVMLLIKHARARYGFILKDAVYGGNIDILKMFMRKSRSGYDDALLVAFQKNNMDMVKILLPRIKYSIVSLLKTAIKSNGIEMIKYVITKSNIRFKPSELSASLAVAARKNNYEAVEYLLGLGAIGFDNAMIGASISGNIDIIKLMIDRSAFRFSEAMILAAEFNQINVIKFLMSNGADSYQESLNSASKNGHMKVVKLMIENGASDFNIPLLKASIGGHVELTKFMIENGATDLNEPLVEASTNGHLEVVKLLLINGANSFSESIYSATRKHYYEIIYILKGAMIYNKLEF
jgi:ankyrin repeat protein